MSDLDDQVLAPEPIRVGSPVLYLGFSATVTRLAADDQVDLIYYEGDRPRVATNVPRGHGPACWLTEAEFEAGRPRTPLELVEDALRRGEQAPKIGLRVVFAEPIGEIGWVHARPTRAVITGVESMDVVDLAIMTPEPPDDPTEPDQPVRFLKGVKHVATAEPKIVKQGYQGHWDYVDGLLVELGPVRKDFLFPAHKCSRCNVGMNRHTMLYFTPPNFRSGPTPVPNHRLCRSCWAQLSAFLGGMDLSHPVEVPAGLHDEPPIDELRFEAPPDPEAYRRRLTSELRAMSIPGQEADALDLVTAH